MQTSCWVQLFYIRPTLIINASLAADENNEEEEDLKRALAVSMENHKEINGDDHKEVDDSSVEVIAKKPAYLPLPEEPKGDRNLLCKVGVRLPDGRRIQRSFLRTDSVQVKVLTIPPSGQITRKYMYEPIRCALLQYVHELLTCGLSSDPWFAIFSSFNTSLGRVSYEGDTISILYDLC